MSVSCIPITTHGNIKIGIIVLFWDVVKARYAMANPKKVLPLLPRNILDGLKLSNKKPLTAPVNINIWEATQASLAKTSSVKSVTAASPDASPSSPSIIFIRFDIKTNQQIVIGIEKIPNFKNGPNGILACVITIPKEITITLDANCIKSFCEAVIAFKSSYRPPIIITKDAIKRGRRLPVFPEIKQILKNVKNITTPPSIGVGLVCTDVAFG